MSPIETHHQFIIYQLPRFPKFLLGVVGLFCVLVLPAGAAYLLFYLFKRVIRRIVRDEVSRALKAGQGGGVGG